MAQPALMAGPREKAPPDPDREWRKLRAHELWDEIELRLRHKWSPYRIHEWLVQDYPSKPRPSVSVLYRYLKTREVTWFVTPLIVSQSTQAKVSRLMVLQEHAELLDVMKGRIQKSITLETSMGQTEGGGGFISPVVSHAMELLSRLLEAHLKMQQALGFAPSPGKHPVGAKGAGQGEDDPGDDRGFSEFIGTLKNLPQDQFFDLVQHALGAPGRAENVIETTAVDVTPTREEPPHAPQAPPDAAQATLPGL